MNTTMKEIYDKSRREVETAIERVCLSCGYGCPDNCENCVLRWIIDDYHGSGITEKNALKQMFIENRRQYGINELGEYDDRVFV